MLQGTAKSYAGLSNEEFDARLQDAIHNMDIEWCVSMLLRYAYEEMSEEFNNEILSNWEDDQGDEGDVIQNPYTCPCCGNVAGERDEISKDDYCALCNYPLFPPLEG